MYGDDGIKRKEAEMRSSGSGEVKVSHWTPEQIKSHMNRLDIKKEESTMGTVSTTLENYYELKKEGLSDSEISRKFGMRHQAYLSQAKKEWGLSNHQGSRTTPAEIKYVLDKQRKASEVPEAAEDDKTSQESPQEPEMADKEVMDETHRDLIEKHSIAEEAAETINWRVMAEEQGEQAKQYKQALAELKADLERVEEVNEDLTRRNLMLQRQVEEQKSAKEKLVKQKTQLEEELAALKEQTGQVPAPDSEDQIRRPDYYHKGGLDPWSFGRANFTQEELIGYHRMTVLAYTARAGLKEPGEYVNDLTKVKSHVDEWLGLLK